MQQTYLITYDICDPKRLRQVFQTMRGYGDHLQLSVFRCDLTMRDLAELREKLLEILHTNEDQVLFVDLGPADGRARSCIESMGRAYVHPERLALVI
jgi:CRISPR-associated protein Cas2